MSYNKSKSQNLKMFKTCYNSYLSIKSEKYILESFIEVQLGTIDDTKENKDIF